MAHTDKTRPEELIDPIVQDAKRLVGLHGALLRSELHQAGGELSASLVLLGAGAGLAATGGVLGSLMLVHGLHRSVRLPLWGCYGLVGGVLGAVGVGLMGAGTRRLSQASLIPYETIAAIQEDVEWIKEGTK